MDGKWRLFSLKKKNIKYTSNLDVGVTVFLSGVGEMGMVSSGKAGA